MGGIGVPGLPGASREVASSLVQSHPITLVYRTNVNIFCVCHVVKKCKRCGNTIQSRLEFLYL